MPRRMSNAPVPSMKIQELSSSRPACSGCAVCPPELGGGLLDQHRELDLRGRGRADVHALLGQLSSRHGARCIFELFDQGPTGGGSRLRGIWSVEASASGWRRVIFCRG